MEVHAPACPVTRSRSSLYRNYDTRFTVGFATSSEIRPAPLQAKSLWFNGSVEKRRRILRQSLQPIKTVVSLYHERTVWR